MSSWWDLDFARGLTFTYQVNSRIFSSDTRSQQQRNPEAINCFWQKKLSVFAFLTKCVLLSVFEHIRVHKQPQCKHMRLQLVSSQLKLKVQIVCTYMSKIILQNVSNLTSSLSRDHFHTCWRLKSLSESPGIITKCVRLTLSSCGSGCSHKKLETSCSPLSHQTGCMISAGTRRMSPYQLRGHSASRPTGPFGY